MRKNLGAKAILYPIPYWVSAHMTNLRKKLGGKRYGT